MQAVILPDLKRCALCDASLRTVCHTGAAPDARIRYVIAMLFYCNISEAICIAAEVLSSRRKKVKCVRLIMNGADISYLRRAILIHGCKRKHADKLHFL